MLHPLARQRLRDARTARGLSLRELGSRLGVSASLLSQIENGRSDPSVSSLYALVTELGLSLDALIQIPESADGATPAALSGSVPSALPLVHPTERRVLEMESGVRWEQLTPGPDPRVDALLTTYEPGGSSSSSGRLMTHTGVEYAYLIEGELLLQIGFETRVMRAGDSLVFESSIPHLYRNEGTVPARGVWFVMQPLSDPVSGASTISMSGAPTSAVDALERFRH
jgi:transcriptional regulator with XRE-family HTH domain